MNPLAQLMKTPGATPRPAALGPSSLAQLIQSVTPLFNAEGPQLYNQAFQHNAAFAKPGPYQTTLPAPQEQQFRQWVAQQHIPFDPNAKTVDYDMRGFYQANGQRAANGHFPDTFKTPYDTTFSAESKYAKPGTPFVWRGNQLVDSRSGQVVYGAKP